MTPERPIGRRPRSNRRLVRQANRRAGRVESGRTDAPSDERSVRRTTRRSVVAGGDRALVIGCGALARELVALTGGLPGVDVACLSPDLHNRPERIPGQVRDRIQEARADGYERIFVAYADCGTGGLLDPVLAEEGVERLAGAHCYEFFAGRAAFAAMADDEPGDVLADRLPRPELRAARDPRPRDRPPPGARADVLRELPPPRLPLPDRRPGPARAGPRRRRRAWTSRSSTATSGSASSRRRSGPSPRARRSTSNR